MLGSGRLSRKSSHSPYLCQLYFSLEASADDFIRQPSIFIEHLLALFSYFGPCSVCKRQVHLKLLLLGFKRSKRLSLLQEY